MCSCPSAVDKADPCLCPSPGGVPPKRPHGHHFASLICFPKPHQTHPICKHLTEPASLISVNSPPVCRTLRGGALGVLFRTAETGHHTAFRAQESTDLGKEGEVREHPSPRRGQWRGTNWPSGCMWPGHRLWPRSKSVFYLPSFVLLFTFSTVSG